jgi:hypothetical protein
VKSVCVNRASCSDAAATTRGAACPTFITPTPPVKSTNTLPSTSVTIAPFASATTIGR